MTDSREEISQRILEFIRNQLREGVMKLPSERCLAETFGVSRSMLRESLLYLEAQGAVEIRERRGVFAKKCLMDISGIDNNKIGIWPEEYIRHVMEIRFIVEVPAASLAARRRTSEDISRISSCIQNLSDASASTGDSNESTIWDAYFHSTVIDSSHNPLLSRIYESFSAFMQNFIAFRRKRLLALNIASDQIVSEHQSILEAIIEQDEEKAAACMKGHLGKTLGMYEVEHHLLESLCIAGGIPPFH